MHGQFLFQLLDFLLVFFDEEGGVEVHFDGHLVGDFHHSRGEFQRGDGLFEVG